MNFITIKHGDYTAVINASKGANCISLRHKLFPNGILREPDYDKGVDNPFLYGAPILFPVNRIAGGKFDFNGTLYTFPINEENTNCHLHGDLHRKEFSVAEKGENFVTCTYGEMAREGFLHDYQIAINYFLDSKGLTQTVTVKNLSDGLMPCMLGFHTTFNADSSCLIQAGVKEEIERNMQNYLPTERVLPLDDIGRRLSEGSFSPQPVSKHYLAEGNTAKIIFPNKRAKIVYEYDEKYLYRLIYGGKDFICLEPQTCVVNSPNLNGKLKNGGFIAIKPHSEISFYTKIFVEEE